MATLIVHAFFAFVFRLLLIAYGQFHDTELAGDGPLYTDIDYRVVTDAASHVWQGQSPYLRATYRYTPLLAYLLTPNLFVHTHWGKLVFALCDVFVGLLIGWLLPVKHRKYALFWLYNPMSAVIATRGSYESIVAVIVLATLYSAKGERERPWITGILLAISVHFKIYPIIYSLALYLHIDALPRTSPSLRPTARRLQLVVSFLITTLLLNGYFYFRYGFEFIRETYLYHITRRDARHNFSPYFYLTYLSPQHGLLSLITFIPQLINTLVLSWRLYDRLELCLFALTFSFVTFNKVTTSQYFLWYLVFIPLLLPNIQLRWRTMCTLLVAWLGAQAWWLYAAYELEFQAQNTFVQIWLASIVFGLVNVLILCVVILNYRQISDAPPQKTALEKKND